MNVYPINITPAGATLAALSGLAWAFALVVVVTNIAGARLALVTSAIGVTTAICSVIVESTSRILRKMDEHAGRVESATAAHACRSESATAAHAENLKQHVLELDRFFAMGIRSDRKSQADAEGLRPWSSTQGTGPFRTHNGDAG